MLQLSEALEIEFKNIVSKEDFHAITAFFSISEEDFHLQKNHYFDTNTFALKNSGCALRIRKKANQFELTFKQPVEAGVLETNQMISEREAAAMIKNGYLPSGEVQELLTARTQAIDCVEFLGSLTTKRAEMPYKDGTLMFDHSFYLKKEDFEIEYEVNDVQRGKEVFLDLLTQLEIPLCPAVSKPLRFWRAKQANY